MLDSPLSVSALILAVLAVVYALYVGKEVVLPVMLALVLKLLLQPVMEFLRKRLRLPGPLAALILIICLFCGIAAVVFTISGPASGWIGKAPEVLPMLKQSLCCSGAHRLSPERIQGARGGRHSGRPKCERSDGCG